MKNADLKVLLAVSRPQKFNSILPQTTVAFNTQLAINKMSYDFLIKEWNPHIVVFDNEHECLIQINTFQINSNMGYILLDHKPNQLNNRVFLSKGFDHYITSEIGFDIFSIQVKNLALRVLSHCINNEQKKLNAQVETFSLGHIQYFPDKHLLKYQGERVKISPTQLKLLDLFFHNEEQLFSRDDIKNKIWPNSNISLRSIDAQISKIKKALPELDHYLINIYGKGYLFSPNNIPKKSVS